MEQQQQQQCSVRYMHPKGIVQHGSHPSYEPKESEQGHHDDDTSHLVVGV